MSKGRMEFLLRLGAGSRAFRVCKESEREERLALSWEKIALGFWACNKITSIEDGKKKDDK